MNFSDNSEGQPQAKLKDLTIPLSHDVQGGIGVGVTSSIDGLLVSFPPYRNMRAGDLISIYLQGESSNAENVPVVDYILSAGDLNKTVFIIVPVKYIKSGWYNIHYTAIHTDSHLANNSDPQTLWIKLDVPGGYDPDPSTTNINEGFKLPALPADIIRNGVNAEQAEKGVPVIIPPYINMRERDKINLSWGGVITPYIVSASEIGKDITIIVNKDVIEEAGDSEQLLVSYEVRDEVYNFSGWSPRQEVLVDVSGDRLDPPVVKQAENNILDLDEIGNKDVIIQVDTQNERFSINDSVRLQLTGQTLAGDNIAYEDYLTVQVSSQVLEFRVPASRIRQFAQSYFIASYTLVKSANDKHFPSWRTTITVKGHTLAELEKPSVREAVGDSLDASLEKATVVVKPFPALTVGSTIELTWAGKTSSGEQYIHFEHATVQSIDEPIIFTINHKDIQILAGGSVSVWYHFTSLNNVVLASESLVLEVQQILDVPAVPDSVNGILMPENVNNFTQVKIPAWTNMVPGDRIDMFWQGSFAEASFQDWTLLSGSAVNKPVNFRVNKKYIEAAIDGIVRVSYQITRSNGAVLTSEALSLRIRKRIEHTLLTPVLPDASSGTLNINGLASSIALYIPAWDGMETGDTISVYLQGIASWQEDHTISASETGKQIDFYIPTDIITANYLSKISIHYKVASMDGHIDASPDLEVYIMSNDILLPEAIVEEASEGKIAPEKIFGNATMYVPAYPDMRTGDIVSAYLSGVQPWNKEIQITSQLTGNNVVFYIPAETIKANLGNEIHINYQIKRNNNVLYTARRLTLYVRSEMATFKAPVVDQAIAGILDIQKIPPEGAIARVPAWENMANGDGVTLNFGPTYKKYAVITASMVNKEVLFTIPFNEVRALSGRSTTVNYVVSQLNGQQIQSQLLTLQVIATVLPAPWIQQALNGTVNINELKAGIQVIIPLAARLQAGDTLKLIWRNAANDDTIFSKTISSAEAGADITFNLPADIALQSVGQRITLYYVIHQNGEEIASPFSSYTITNELVKSHFRIFGARAVVGNYHAAEKSHLLIGFDKHTHQPLALQWKYAGEEQSVTTSWFTDTQPWKILQVSSAIETIELYPLNLFGNGDDADSAEQEQGAMLARLDNGHMIAWGSRQHGADLPEALNGKDILNSLCTSSGAVGAVKKDTGLMAWGDEKRGGKLSSSLQKQTKVVSLSAGSQAISALLSTGKVVAWGNSQMGGTVPANIAAFTNMVKVVGNGGAFAALRANRRLVAWGRSVYGGVLPVDISNLTKVTDVVAARSAFAALTTDNAVVSWGDSALGGKLPKEIKALKDVSEIMASNDGAFVIKRSNGRIAVWGNEADGGILPEDFSSIADIIEVVATRHAFIALRSNGSVIAWGDAEEGGLIPREIALLTDIVQVATTARSCAVLRQNGTVMVWGNAVTGGSINTVVGKLNNCLAIYSNSGAFTAITEDKKVISWGKIECGGDNSRAASQLDGAISHYRVTPREA